MSARSKAVVLTLRRCFYCGHPDVNDRSDSDVQLENLGYAVRWTCRNADACLFYLRGHDGVPWAFLPDSEAPRG